MLEREWRCAGMDYEEAVKAYANMVTRLCLVRLGPTPDVEDCFQNVFLKLLQQPPDAKDPERLKAWLITVTVRETVNWRRFWRKGKTVSLEELPQTADATPGDREVMDILFSLPLPYRDVLFLHDYAGYTLEETAALLGRNVNTVKTHLYRGRERFRRLWRESAAPMEKGVTNHE